MSHRIRYLAAIAEDPDKLVEYYRTYYGLSVLGRNQDGDVSVTDGFYNLTFLKRRSGMDEDNDEVGLHHFGLEIDDIREIENRLEEFAPRADIRQESGDLHHGEFRVFDPNNIPVSLSLRSFGVQGEQRQMPQIRHIAMMVPKNDEMATFFVNVFGFRETSISRWVRDQGRESRVVADGSTNLAILAEPSLSKEREPEGANLKWGVNHFGFLVEDMASILDRLPREETSLRPSVRPMAEYRTHDPEGNPMDISMLKGYEIDDGLWVPSRSA